MKTHAWTDWGRLKPPRRRKDRSRDAMRFSPKLSGCQSCPARCSQRPHWSRGLSHLCLSRPLDTCARENLFFVHILLRDNMQESSRLYLAISRQCMQCAKLPHKMSRHAYNNNPQTALMMTLKGKSYQYPKSSAMLKEKDMHVQGLQCHEKAQRQQATGICAHHASALLVPVAPENPLLPGAAPCAATQPAQISSDYCSAPLITYASTIWARQML